MRQANPTQPATDASRDVLVLTGATIVTMDPARRVIQEGALVSAAGRIAWLGPQRDLPEIYRDASLTALPGRVILPGFINLHTHAALVVLRGIGDDLGVAPAYDPRVPQGVFLSPQDVYCFSLLGGLEALLFGTTCIVDNYIYADQVAQALAAIGLRAVISERLHDADLFLVPQGRYEFEAERGAVLLQRNLDLIAKWEGAADGRIHTRLGPHAPDTCSAAYLTRIRQAGEQANVGWVTHLAQSRREVAQIQRRAGQSPTAHLDSLGLLGPQMVAGHCIYVSEADQQRLAQTHTHVAHLSGSNAKGGMMAPIRDLQDRGVNIGLGTDNMAGDMIEVMRLAVCTARMRGDDNQALRALEALEMATLSGARALGMEAEIGSLEVGKRADLVVVDFQQPHLIPVIDPVANLIYNGLGRDVERVYVAGELLVADGHVRGVDSAALMQEAQGRAEALWAKRGGPPPTLLRRAP